MRDDVAVWHSQPMPLDVTARQAAQGSAKLTASDDSRLRQIRARTLTIGHRDDRDLASLASAAVNEAASREGFVIADERRR